MTTTQVKYRSPKLLIMLIAAMIPATIGTIGCQEAPETAEEAVKTFLEGVVPESAADSLAMKAVEYAGGPSSFAAIENVRFDFTIDRGGEKALRNRHLWNRKTGQYRLERPIGSDTLLVVLFSTWTQKGQAFYNGVSVYDSALETKLVESAIASHLNDLYWFLSVEKFFDKGVIRTVDQDSSTADHRVLKLTFDNVGYTPEHQYWFSIEPATGKIARWSFLLSENSRVRTYNWEEYQNYDVGGGTVTLSGSKRAGEVAVMNSPISFPTSVDERLYSSPEVLLD